jgi:acetoin utilization protein AcuB
MPESLVTFVRNTQVHQIMTRNPIVLHEDATIDDAIDLFKMHSISCIPIVNSENRPVGIVSWRDILKNLRQDVGLPK